MSSAKGFKHVGFLTRKKGQSFEDFVQHWEHVHTAITLKLPGLKGYVLNPFDSPIGQKAYEDVPNFVEQAAITYVTEIRKL